MVVPETWNDFTDLTSSSVFLNWQIQVDVSMRVTLKRANFDLSLVQYDQQAHELTDV